MIGRIKETKSSKVSRSHLYKKYDKQLQQLNQDFLKYSI